METMFNEPIVLLMAIVLIPLVPTVLLYSLFENYAELRNVKRGLKLGGAVAFYFVLFGAAYPMFRSFNTEGRNKEYEAQIERLESEKTEFANEIQETVRQTQSAMTQMANDHGRRLNELKTIHAQELSDLRTSFHTRVENLTGTFNGQIAEEKYNAAEARRKLAELQSRGAGLDTLRLNLEGEWRWEATSSGPALQAGLAPVAAEQPSGAPAQRKSTGTATFQRDAATGEIEVIGTVDGQPGNFHANEIILDQRRLTYIFEHQPSGTIGVSWLKFVKDASGVKSMTGYWVLAGREGKGTLSFFRAGQQAAQQ